MKTKLTLSVDKEIVQDARLQAKKSGRSVSKLFSDYIRSKNINFEDDVNTGVDVIVGSLKNYNIDDSKPSIRSAYAKKYSN